MKRLLPLCFLAWATCAQAKAPPQPTEPETHPNWGETAQRGVTMLSSNLFDPGSAQINWSSGFQWGYMKPLIGRRTFGWIACGSINAKNRLGGYVGAQGFLVFIQPSGTITASMQVEWVSTCDSGPFVPVPPELVNTASPVAAAGPVVGVAEELKKLAELRDQGIITAEEFAAQKAKLLGR